MVSLSGGGLSKPEMLDLMGQRLRHRGPDHHGTATHPNAAIGAERLRVIDLTPAGDQPFAAAHGQVLLAVNGAIYNAPELRRRYSDFEFQSQSDSETVLPLYLDRGAEGLAELEQRIASGSEWPFSGSTVLRFGLYTALGLGSWLGAAFVERLLESALR